MLYKAKQRGKEESKGSRSGFSMQESHLWLSESGGRASRRISSALSDKDDLISLKIFVFSSDQIWRLSSLDLPFSGAPADASHCVSPRPLSSREEKQAHTQHVGGTLLAERVAMD
jgi:hypothetical protein